MQLQDLPASLRHHSTVPKQSSGSVSVTESEETEKEEALDSIELKCESTHNDKDKSRDSLKKIDEFRKIEDWNSKTDLADSSTYTKLILKNNNLNTFIIGGAKVEG
jgi:hypothetical protein